ncbi:MAG: hypothetical protein ACOZAR_01615 [Patescibacteria group bacterium]
MNIDDCYEKNRLHYATRILPELTLEEELAAELELSEETKKAIEKYLETGEKADCLINNDKVNNITIEHFLISKNLSKLNLTDLKTIWERINNLKKKENT